MARIFKPRIFGARLFKARILAGRGLISEIQVEAGKLRRRNRHTSMKDR